MDSGLSQAESQQFRGVINRLLNQMKVGASANHVGLAQYGRDVKSEFNLTTYQTKEQIQNAIKRVRLRRTQPTDPRNLGFALEHASNHFFTSEVGGRADQGYQQYLIIFSGKDSDDEVQRAARRIKSSGVKVIGMNFGAPTQRMTPAVWQRHWYQFDSNAAAILKSILEKQEVEVQINASSGKNFLTFFFPMFFFSILKWIVSFAQSWQKYSH